MRRKHFEHLALIIWLEMKETVPGEQAVEGSAERQRPHIGDDPILFGKASTTKRDQRRRGINPGHAQSACYQIRCNRRPSAASQIEDARVLRERLDEAGMPNFVIPTTLAAISIPSNGVTLVVLGNSVCKLGHGLQMDDAARVRKPRRNFDRSQTWTGPGACVT